MASFATHLGNAGLAAQTLNYYVNLFRGRILRRIDQIEFLVPAGRVVCVVELVQAFEREGQFKEPLSVHRVQRHGIVEKGGLPPITAGGAKWSFYSPITSEGRSS